jgi:addiction module HigA family antidote
MMNIVATRHIPPTHPGEDLLELIQDHGLTQYRLAKELGVPQTRIMQIVKGRRSISADTALRLARFFGMSKEFWLNRQMHYDLECTQMAVGMEIDSTVKPMEQSSINRSQN